MTAPAGELLYPLYLLDLLVDDDSQGMLGNIVHTARLAMVAFMRHSFLDGSCSLWSTITIYLSVSLCGAQTTSVLKRTVADYL